MKQELVRTKSKISSLKREMSSIQQLHLAQQQQQVHVKLSAPSMISPRSEFHQHLHPNDPFDSPNRQSHRQQEITTDMKNLSTSSNEESVSPSTNNSCSTQTVPMRSPTDQSTSPSDEQLRLYLTETLQREKDSDV